MHYTHHIRLRQLHSTNDEAAVIRNPKQWDQHLFSHFHLSRYIGGFFFETIPTTIVEKITIFPLNKNIQHILYPPTQYLFREEKRSIRISKKNAKTNC